MVVLSNAVSLLRKEYKSPLDTEYAVCCLLERIGPDLVRQLYQYHRKDEKELDRILKEEIWDMRQLDVRGDELDLKDITRTGAVLKALLELVMKKELKNEKKVLLLKAKEIEKDYE